MKTTIDLKKDFEVAEYCKTEIVVETDKYIIKIPKEMIKRWKPYLF